LSHLRAVPGGVEMRLKVVPGASRSAIAGLLGDRLKVRVAAPPEDGRANRAVCDLLRDLAGCPVQVVAGATQPLKTVLLAGLDIQTATQRLPT
jgi:uncharacterized protein (TIGR00251 family)